MSSSHSTVNRRAWSFLSSRRKHRVTFEHNTLTGSQLLLVNGRVYHQSSYQYKLTGCLYWYLEGSLCELYIQPGAGSTSSFFADLSGGSLRYILTVDGKELKPSDEPVVTAWRVDVTAPPLTVRAPNEAQNKLAFSLVEFEHRSMAILVDGVRIECQGDFLDEHLIALAAAEAAAAAGSSVASDADSATSAPSAALFGAGDGSSGSVALGSQYPFLLPLKYPGVVKTAGDPTPGPGHALGNRECVLIVQPLGSKGGLLRTTLIVDGKPVPPLVFPRVDGGSASAATPSSAFPPLEADAALVGALATALSSPTSSSASSSSSSSMATSAAASGASSPQPSSFGSGFPHGPTVPPLQPQPSKKKGFFSALFSSASDTRQANADLMSAGAAAGAGAASGSSSPSSGHPAVLRFEVGKGFVRDEDSFDVPPPPPSVPVPAAT